jgi:CheY-like chemotaxis protein
MTQEATAELLALSTRYVREQQAKAVRVLARNLWTEKQALPLAQESGDQSGIVSAKEPGSRQLSSGSWSAQVKRELLSLRDSSPHAVTDVGKALLETASLLRGLGRKHHVAMEVAPLESDLTAIIHPSAFHQIILSAIQELVKVTPDGSITIEGKRTNGEIRITLVASPTNITAQWRDGHLTHEILDAYRGSIEYQPHDNSYTVRIHLPTQRAPDRVVVLVVDDNLDLVSFYRAYVSGTRYSIVHIPRGDQVFEAIDMHQPDIIILDVMLPDVDGWQLLVQLHGHPETRLLPIIVCSVVRDAELAQSLGAILHVPKPVGRKQFLRALDEALRSTTSAAFSR